MKNTVCALSLLLALSSVSARAGVQPIGAEFQAGTCADCEKKAPSVAGAKTGEFAVVWEGASRTDPQALLARFFAKTGAPRGAQVQVNKLLPPDQYDAAVAVDTAGNTIVAWSEMVDENSEIFVQRFDKKLKALGAAIRVNVDNPAAAATPLDLFPALAASPDGGFVVAWIQTIPPDPAQQTPPKVMLRRFDKAGKALGGQIPLNTGLSRGTRPDVCVSKTGQAVVAWATVDIYKPFQNNKNGISLRRIAKNGTPAGGELVVAPPKAYDSDAAVACAANGSFVVAWHTEQLPAADWMDIAGQRFTAAGVKSGAAFRINTAVDGDQRNAAISMDEAGNFVVVWESRGAGDAIAGRRFKANGVADGAELVIHAQVTGEQRPTFADVAHVGSAGEFVVVWQAGKYVVTGRRFKVTAAAN
jgi:hypothetical protein